MITICEIIIIIKKNQLKIKSKIWDIGFEYRRLIYKCTQ